MRLRAVLPLLLALALPGPAAAWSAPGHRIVARIAEGRLSPAARRMVAQVLGDSSLADVAPWADGLDDPDARRLHYVNIPFDAAGYDARRDCPAGACAVAAIERFAADLEHGTSEAARADALRWLVHLVGDLHQPLHAGDRRDRGGNEVSLAFPHRGPEKLHRVWDEEVLQPLLGRRRPDEAARLLATRLRAEDAARWARELDPASWANASSALARELYRELGADPGLRGVVRVDRAYARSQRARVEEALQRAGVRLAALLDRIAAAREARAGRVR
jgi:nuclease S1